MVVQELTLSLPNRPGVLQSATQILAEGRINVASLSLNSQGLKSNVRMVVSDTQRALSLLRKNGYKIDAHELLVVHLEDKAGSFAKVLGVLAKHRINVVSATILVTRDRQKVLVGLEVSNTSRARHLLAQAGFLAPSAEDLITNEDLVSSRLTEVPGESVGLLL